MSRETSTNISSNDDDFPVFTVHVMLHGIITPMKDENKKFPIGHIVSLVKEGEENEMMIIDNSQQNTFSSTSSSSSSSNTQKKYNGKIVENSSSSFQVNDKIIILFNGNCLPIFSRYIIYKMKIKMIKEDLTITNRAETSSSTIKLFTKSASVSNGKYINTDHRLINNLTLNYEKRKDSLKIFTKYKKIHLIELLDISNSLFIFKKEQEEEEFSSLQNPSSFPQIAQKKKINYETFVEIYNELSYEEKSEIQLEENNFSDIHSLINKKFFFSLKKPPTIKEKKKIPFDLDLLKYKKEEDVVFKYKLLKKWFSNEEEEEETNNDDKEMIVESNNNENINNQKLSGNNYDNEEIIFSSQNNFSSSNRIHFYYKIHEKSGKMMLSDVNSKTCIKNIFLGCITNPLWFVIFNNNNNSAFNIDFRTKENNYLNTDEFKMKDSFGKIPILASKSKYFELLEDLVKVKIFSEEQAHLFKMAYLIGEKLTKKMYQFKTDQLYLRNFESIIQEEEEKEKSSSSTKNSKLIVIPSNTNKAMFFFKIQSILTNDSFTIDSFGRLSKIQNKSLIHQLQLNQEEYYNNKFHMTPFIYHKILDSYELREQFISKNIIMNYIKNYKESLLSSLTTINTKNHKNNNSIIYNSQRGTSSSSSFYLEKKKEENSFSSDNAVSSNDDGDFSVHKNNDNNYSLNNEQNHVLEIIKNYFITCIVGEPGTGKSFIIPSIVKKYGGHENVIILTCTGNGVGILKSKGNENVKTIYSAYKEENLKLLSKMEEKKKNVRVVIIEEASMLDNKNLAMVLSIYDYRLEKIILIGGENQIGPTDLGNPYKKLQEYFKNLNSEQEKEEEEKTNSINNDFSMLTEDEVSSLPSSTQKSVAVHSTTIQKIIYFYQFTKNFRRIKISSNTNSSSSSSSAMNENNIYNNLEKLQNIYHMDVTFSKEECDSLCNLPSKENEGEVVSENNNDHSLIIKTSKTEEELEESIKTLFMEDVGKKKNSITPDLVILSFRKDSVKEMNKKINEIMIKNRFPKITEKMKSSQVYFQGQRIMINLFNIKEFLIKSEPSNNNNNGRETSYSFYYGRGGGRGWWRGRGRGGRGGGFQNYNNNGDNNSSPEEEKIYNGEIYTIQKIFFYDKVLGKKEPNIQIINLKKEIYYQKNQPINITNDFKQNHVLILIVSSNLPFNEMANSSSSNNNGKKPPLEKKIVLLLNNQDLSTIKPPPSSSSDSDSDSVSSFFTSTKKVKVFILKKNQILPGWSITINKSENQEYNSVYLYIPEKTTEELKPFSHGHGLVAISRARKNLKIFCLNDFFEVFSQIKQNNRTNQTNLFV